MNDLTVHDGGWGISIRQRKGAALLAYTNREGAYVFQSISAAHPLPIYLQINYASEIEAREALLEAYGL